MQGIDFALSPRLKFAAQKVRKNSIIADVGCDHAYLSIYLLKQKIIPFSIACDIKKGPLQTAQKNLEKYGFTQNASLRLGFGLDVVLPDEVNDIVICGMGGITISEIIKKAVWLKDEKYRLILQPMTHIDYLRYYLCKAGFEIIEEDLVAEGKKIYVIQTVQYSGKQFIPDDYFCAVGNTDFRNQYYIDYLKNIKRVLSKKKSGLVSAEKHDQKMINKLSSIIDRIAITIQDYEQ